MIYTENDRPHKIVTGLYGGSFNPIHIGHTTFARELVTCGAVDQTWLVVSPGNPLKHSGLWDDGLRLQLAHIALAGIDEVRVSDIEFSLPRPSYTITTLDTLSTRYPGREFVLIIGQDNWDCFHDWYRWQDIQAGYRIIVIPRSAPSDTTPGTFPSTSAIAPLSLVTNGVLQPMPGKSVHLIDISSTWIRDQIAHNPDYQGQGLNPDVWEYIRKNRRRQ